MSPILSRIYIWFTPYRRSRLFVVGSPGSCTATPVNLPSRTIFHLYDPLAGYLWHLIFSHRYLQHIPPAFPACFCFPPAFEGWPVVSWPRPDLDMEVAPWICLVFIVLSTYRKNRFTNLNQTVLQYFLCSYILINVCLRCGRSKTVEKWPTVPWLTLYYYLPESQRVGHGQNTQWLFLSICKCCKFIDAQLLYFSCDFAKLGFRFHLHNSFKLLLLHQFLPDLPEIKTVYPHVCNLYACNLK